MRDNHYFSCRSIQDQRTFCLELNQFTKEEALYFENRDVEVSKQKHHLLRKLQRKADKYKNNILEYV